MIDVVNVVEWFRWQRFWGRRSFWGGAAMASPFYAEFFSWRWVVLLAVPFFLYSLLFRSKLNKLPLAVIPMILLLGLHGASLFFTTTPFVGLVVKDLVIASFLLFSFVLADEDMQVGFFSFLIPLALVTATVGLLKAALLDRGYLIGLVADSCIYYPAGSSLCVNYNNLAFMWLVAALGCMRTRFWWAVPILVAAGALSSSRRFIVLMIFLPFFWILLQGWSATVKVIFAVLLSALLINVVSDSESFERFRFGGEPYKVLSLNGVLASGDMSLNRSTPEAMLGTITGGDVSINRSTPEAMLGTMADGSLGASSRLEFWALGASMVSWWPQGWSYHEVFSCKFSSCSDFHYPHMTIISEWIIGGVLFALVAIAFFGWPFLQIIMARQLFAAVLFFLAVPYALISGDTVLSLPGCVSCMLVALSSVKNGVVPHFGRNILK